MEELIKEYALGYTMLREVIEGLTEEEIRYKPAPDKWSIHEILIHVTDSEICLSFLLLKGYGKNSFFFGPLIKKRDNIKSLISQVL